MRLAAGVDLYRGLPNTSPQGLCRPSQKKGAGGASQTSPRIYGAPPGYMELPPAKKRSQ